MFHDTFAYVNEAIQMICDIMRAAYLTFIVYETIRDKVTSPFRVSHTCIVKTAPNYRPLYLSRQDLSHAIRS